MKFIKQFETIQGQDQPLVGGKAFSLGFLVKRGVNIPNGFVVTSHAFRRFFDEANIDQEAHAMWDTINVDDVESLEQHSEKIRGVIGDSRIPEKIEEEILNAYKSLGEKVVAVRSSATAEDSSIASWAGELESYLYVTQTNFLKSIKLCWASLYTPRAILYRSKRNMTWKDIAVAVIVQKMVNSHMSGVCFTANPVTRVRNDMVIEAVYGLGELLVQGIVTPDRYYVDKKEDVIVDVITNAQKKMYVQGKTGGITEVGVPKKRQLHQKLTGKEIITLTEICKKIEKHFRSPQDIEWAIEDDKFYILQSRPITTL